MNTDRELLELAAKAAGYEIQLPQARGGFWLGSSYWNPLTDDGDALRLAVKLGLFVDTRNYDRTLAGFPINRAAGKFGDVQIEHGSDPLAATRRAIVRAAAEIGRALP